MRLWHLALIAAALAAAAMAGMSVATPENQLPALLAWVSIVCLLTLPAFWARALGARPLATWLVAVLSPLLPLELLLAIQAHQQRGLGGDLQGIEALLMTYVVPPVALIAGSLMTLLACLLIRPPQPD
ncbi:MAG TPA: hypothetical protein VGD66_11520 [Allosphingosinicella sp.]|jgi:hypothetical protein